MADPRSGVGAEQVAGGVPVTINGKELLAREGELLIEAAQRHGIYIPRFCYHPRMEPVGMCRMCLVEVDTGRGFALQPSCMLTCTPGMVVDTESEVTRKAQDGVLEFLLINHPLDCPVCDKGGECPLQDQTVAYGPGESRFVEEKRHYEKPIPISDLVLLDRERCILCDRCTRFADTVAGDPLIHFIHRGSNTEVNTFPDHPFASYFSGNTVQICPVGALTSVDYRFRARPWDLEETESTCQSCAVGCRMAVQSSRNQVLRYVGLDLDDVNWGWLCDKGRYGFQALNHEDRLGTPLVRSGDELVPSRWNEAYKRAVEAIRAALESHGPAGVAVLGGSRLSNESAYAWAKLAKGVIGTDNVDAQLGDGLPAELILGLPRATIDETCTPGGTVILFAPDLKEELPVLFLRLRHAVLRDRVTVIDCHPHANSFTTLAAVSLHGRPGEQAELAKVLTGALGADREVAGVAPDRLARARALVEAAQGPVTVVLGRQTLGESGSAIADAASVLLAGLPGVRFLSALRRANVHGALEMGLAPGVLPGRVGLDEGRSWFASHWPGVPEVRGLDARGVLEEAAAGRIGALILLGADPLADFPDRKLAEQALAGAGCVIAVDQFLTGSSQLADVVFPAAGFAEVDGTTTNLEGRVLPLGQRVTPPGTAQPDWVIAAELARRMGADLGIESVRDVQDEIRRVAPARTDRAVELAEAAGDEAHAELEVGAEAQAELGTGAEVSGDADMPQAVTPTPPPLIEHRPGPIADPPPVDSYSLRLVVTRKLYDAGVIVSHSASLSSLAPGTVLRVNGYDFDRLGVVEGSVVQVKSPRGRIDVEIRIDNGIPRGTAAIVVNQPGVPVTELIDASERITDVRIERGDA